jgi:hypothetical protein
MCATETWDYFSTDATGAVPPAGLYMPSEADRALGAALRGSWLELARTGSISSLGWEAVSPDAAAGGAPLATCLGREEGGTAENFKTETCEALESLGFGRLEWWIN